MKSRNKYKAKGVRDPVHGYFHSKGEYNRFTDLQFLQLSGQIQHLKRQVRFPLKVNDMLITNYIVDFTYLDDGVLVAEDFKGYPTPEFIIKKKLFLALWSHEYELRITSAR